MYDLLLRLVGKTCEIQTVDNYYEGTVKEVNGNILIIFDRFEEKDVYVNLMQFISICEEDSEIKKDKPKKKGFFSRKNDMDLEDM
ncbi:MAG: hypothetical protein IJX42_04965 [Oscillospiraceae bacterium]|nr:hypothetical protein [Oscillospiraceae bacterium]MBQ8378465.1 hypothetical protein [Oscillospiraceae bacterium]